MAAPICLVTGAPGGLGPATALALARRGAAVVLGCSDAQRGEAARAAVQAAATGPAQAANPFVRWLSRVMAAPPARAAESLAGLALKPEFASATGQFFAFQSPIASNAYSYDAGVQERLWVTSLKLSGLAQ